MFGEKDVFLSIINPLYFIEELGDKGKALLERHLPAIPREEVMARLSAETRERLSGKELLSPDVSLKKLREQSEEAKKTQIYLQGQLDLAEAQASEKVAKESALQNRIDELKREKEALERKQFDGIDVSELQSRMADLSAQYSELAGDRESGTDARLLELTQRLGERRAAVYVPKYAEHIAAEAEKVNALSTRYKGIDDYYKSLAATM